MTRLPWRRMPWAFWRLARGAAVLGSVPGMCFAKVLGSGRDGGFGLTPGLDCQGVFATFSQLDQALAFALDSDAAKALRSDCLEQAVVVGTATAARGSWSGAAMAADPQAAALGGDGPVAALTRAAIRPRHVRAFWAHSPPAEQDLARAAGCRLAVGLGEAPLLRQATFSLWDSVAAMDAYARQGAHQRAIAASWQRGFFSEWMFVRLSLRHVQGSWGGKTLDGLLTDSVGLRAARG